MEFKVSTMGNIENLETQTEIAPDTPDTASLNPQSEEGQSQADTSSTETIEGQGLDANAVQVIPESTQQPAIIEEEENTSSLSLNFGDPATATETEATVTAPKVTWQDAIKGVDRKEIAKALGLSDFALELDEYISKGYNAVDYLNARAIDYTKISNVDIIKEQLRRELPDATNQQLELYIAKKYNQNELAEDDDREFGSLQMQTEANRIRRELIAKQQSFKIPETQISSNKDEWEREQQAIIQQQQQEAQQQRDYLINHQETQNLLSNKRVSIELGEGNKPFNFKLDDRTANHMVTLLTDSEAWGKAVRNEKGEPNVGLLQKLVVHAINPNYEKDIYNAGKMAGMRSRVEESQNVKKPTGTPVVDMNPPKFQVKGTGTIGSH